MEHKNVIYTENLNSRLCKHCNNQIIPVRGNGDPHDVHGYKFYCPVCKVFIAWGGREKAIRDTNNKRVHSTNWNAKRLSIDYCEICGATLEMVRERGESLEAHHKKAISEGGIDAPENILVVCSDCHRMIHHKRTYSSHNSKFFASHKRLRALLEIHPDLCGECGEDMP